MAEKQESGDMVKKSVEELLNEKLSALRAPFPEECVNQKPKPTKAQNSCPESEKKHCDVCGGYHHPRVIHLSYVGHAALTARLLDIDPMWNWEPVSRDERGLPLFDESNGLWIKLTVCGVTRLGYGSAENTAQKPSGDVVKEIIGDAIRNAAMRFGAALEMWFKGDKLMSTMPQENNELPPEEPAKVYISQMQIDKMDAELKARKADQTKFLAVAGVDSLAGIEVKNYAGLMKQIMRKAKPAADKPAEKPAEKPVKKSEPDVATFECPQVPGLKLTGNLCGQAPCSETCEAYKAFVSK